MRLAQTLIIVLLTPILLLSYLLAKFVFKKQIPSWLIKTAVSILGVVFFVRYMYDNDAIRNTVAGVNNIFSNTTLNKLAVVLVWFTYAAILLVVFQPFFKVKTLKNLVKFFAFPMSIITLCCTQITTWSIMGASAYETFNFRGILIALEAVLLFVCAFIIFVENGAFKITKKEVLYFFISILPVLLVTMPSFAPQTFFGTPTRFQHVTDLSFQHRLVLYGAVIIPFAIYFSIFKQNYETKRFVLLFICVATLVTYSLNKKFDSFNIIEHPSWLPLHLCNTAMYILPLCILFKWDKLFYFTYFINVFGAFIAMLMPNYSETLSILSSSIVSFYVNHYIAFFMPILLVALKIFERPKLKQFIWSMVAFAIYFSLIIFINALFTNFDPGVDYFFTNSDYVADKLGSWAETLRLRFVWSVNLGKYTLVFYPLYQFLFFLGYVAIGVGVWFVFEQCYQITDVYADMGSRRARIKLDRLALERQRESLSEEEKQEMAERKVELKLIHFTKRYGNSEVYAVKDANLTINGGEIFGFLGPNGAGKSTIIKSIVGIQPITEGRIEVCGYDVDSESVKAKHEIGFVPDHYALYEKLTGREYINYIADLYGVSKEDRTKAINKYVELFELQAAFDNQMKTYSHGMKQKIAIISALVHNPKVWIMDEPLTGLDSASIFQVKECMKQHAAEGNIVFFSSHIIDVVERICDKIAIINKGKILVCKSLNEIENEGDGLEKYYLNMISRAHNFNIPVHEKSSAANVEVALDKKKANEAYKNVFGIDNFLD